MDKETSDTFARNFTSDNIDLSLNTSNSYTFTGRIVLRTLQRSKSVSCVSPDSFSSGEVRRMRERLLRTNAHVTPSSIMSLSRYQKMTLLSLALVDFMSFCSMSIMAPFFPREAFEKGMSDTMTGFVFSFYALVMFLSSPIFGKILPVFGAKFLFILGIFVAGLCNILFGLLEYISNYTLFTTFCILIRGFEALGASAFSTASYIFVVNSFPNNIGSVIGILETFVGLGMSTGPAVGGILYSLGGFSVPFYVLGVAMVFIGLINLLLLPNVEDCDSMTNKTTSMMKLIKIPAVIVTGLVVTVVSSIWAFLEPTLEPHLRDFNLSPEKIGLIFLLFSALYGISSPAWGWVADRINHPWLMMVAGLFMCTLGLLLLGPCPYIPVLSQNLWLDLVALSILGISVALTLMPTFLRILTSATKAGYSDSLVTYSVVAGVWSCMYSLGEVLGPALGGFLMGRYGFPMASTVMATVIFSLAIFTTIFFILNSTVCKEAERKSDSGISESWRSSNLSMSNEHTPLLLSTIDGGLQSSYKKQYYTQNARNCDFDYYHTLMEPKTSVSVSKTGKGSSEI
ncbi:MFS-type transporter SLC18B1-like isoform X1 [Diabrotica virgifera virgifera]|uniref:Major facilitator superfamily (MFS) profile domain-containing protein n=1 Tax=Diabrotica virgifera virgifera TaxID=50390 RepID=A0ABM5K1S5_DIAVI|nr:MFS-type transporter SLC18B1-like isoform X1 [Diabrotica virgifera virgifera]